MKEMKTTSPQTRERALLVGVMIRGVNDEWDVRDTLDELAQLAESAGAEVLGRVLCKQAKIQAGHFIGKGKAEEIGKQAQELEANLVIFDEDLSPAQGRNLEETLGVRVLDRTQLILDIFARRAQTREGCLQVELAQHRYLLPRLRRMWTHLERQAGGIGLKGPGETQIEMDRRRIQELIRTLTHELELVRTRRAEQRRGRHRHGWALVSIVGYTNAGKSTLLNRLAGAEIYAKDQLFATLDPTTRQVELPNREPCLMTDTVGFIRKLPHHLVDSFKATLEEVVEADLLLHVVDCAHPQVEQQIAAVHAVLQEIGADDKPVLYVLNKIDKEEGRHAARRLAHTLGRAAAVSAVSGEGIENLLNELADSLKGDKRLMKLAIPMSEGRLLAQLKQSATVLEEKYEGEAAELLVRVPAQLVPRCEPFQME
jgi:GTP-binding protein HflX